MTRTLFLILLALLLPLTCHAEGSSRPPVRVILPAARDVNAPGGLPLRKLVDIPMRDPNVTLGPDGFYYLVGTTDPAPGYTTIGSNDPNGQMWTVNDGVRMWKSLDMVHWKSLGLIWSLDRDGTWAHWWTGPNPGAAVWAPEIHYLKGTYWIPYCAKLPGAGLHIGAGLLKSKSGKPEGPYRDVQVSGPLGMDDDASLFQDTDGQVYFLFDGYKIARMKPDMSGLAEAPRDVTFTQPPGWGEGIYMVKVHGKYIFINSGTAAFDPRQKDTPGQTTYDCFSAVSSGSIYGPYSPRYRAIPHDGHNNLFQDKRGHWWATYFGSDPWAPFAVGGSGRASVMPVTIAADGNVRFAHTSPWPRWRYTTSAPADNWTQPRYDDARWKTGGGAFGDPAVSRNGQVTDVGTVWTAGDVWLRRSFHVTAPVANPQLYLRHNGPIQVSINGQDVAHLDGDVSDYKLVPLSDPTILHPGLNTIAVHGIGQASLPDYVDVGIVDTPAPPAIVPLVFTSEATGQAWRYTTQAPATGWQRPVFDDSGWQSGTALFGNAVPGVNTPWTGADIWLRRTFMLDRTPQHPALRLYHDEDVQVFIDGKPAASLLGYTNSYVQVPVSAQARAALTPGRHTLAVHCHQTIGGQGIDVGLVDIQQGKR